MSSTPITQAVVLAAGMGSRLRESSAHLPKPLCPVAGIPLLRRVLGTLKAAGISEVAIIVGYEGGQIRDSLTQSSLGLDIRFVENTRYRDKNGVSLIAAAEFITRDCVLTMSDHLYPPVLVKRLLAPEFADGHCALAVDYKIDLCSDIDDATKVKIRDGHIDDINKQLENYDALDTGVFRIGPSLITELQALDREHGDCTLSEGVKLLASRDMFHTVDVGDARWIDVDTPEALAEAERDLTTFTVDR